ncbi:hypothetical protein K457DRAFT_120783 [Linnemannia elongata AG-77]|uniref:Uncharacterized protein n=1 Tax=Linnemannia elongata AG-77 TaxID=1314771 RepID=A0A197KG85_9FUNG|nr:hypothetical protein K457DRAFT_120783 [Linnemannia elongata AG-77]
MSYLQLHQYSGFRIELTFGVSAKQTYYKPSCWGTQLTCRSIYNSFQMSNIRTTTTGGRIDIQLTFDSNNSSKALGIFGIGGGIVKDGNGEETKESTRGAKEMSPLQVTIMQAWWSVVLRNMGQTSSTTLRCPFPLFIIQLIPHLQKQQKEDVLALIPILLPCQ